MTGLTVPNAGGNSTNAGLLNLRLARAACIAE
jgi:hypothetical protein